MSNDAKPKGRRPRTAPRAFTPLAQETRSYIPTADAAHHLCLSEQTLRTWSCSGDGPIRPIQLPGRLGLLWPVEGIVRLLSPSHAEARQDADAKMWRRRAMAAAAALEMWREAAKAKDAELMDKARAARDKALLEMDAATKEIAR